jgi:signal transduction histidine kinase
MSVTVRRPDAFRVWHGALVHDALPALALAVWAVAYVLTDPQGLPRAPLAVALPWIAVLVGPLVWRRRWPVAVFAGVVATSAAAIGLRAVLGPAPLQLQQVAEAALLLALVTVAAHRPRYAGPACAAFLGVWGLVALPHWSPDNTTELSGTAVVLWCCAVTGATLAGRYLRTRRAYIGALRERAARLERERDQQARMAATQERARIARELHDVVSHHLAGMIALADGAAVTAPDPGADLMRQVASTGRQAIDEMRLILGLLRDGAAVSWAPQPGIAQLADLIAETCATGLPVRLVVTGPPRDLGPGLELTVYRIVQEALANVRDHAHQATGAQVRLGYRDGHVEVEVADDGRAVGPARAPGHGLLRMNERAAAFAGSLEAGPAPEGGWRVRVLLTAPNGAR